MRRRLLVSLALAALATGSACGCGERAPVAPKSDSPGGASSQNGDAPASDASSAELAGFPVDIPIPEGLRTTSVTSGEPGSLVALFTGDLDPDAVARSFEEGLRKQGWTIDESRNHGDDLGLFARKQQRIASVVVTRLSGKLHVELGVWGPSE